MNKRILSILLCLMLVASLLVLAVPVNAVMPSHNVDLKVTADKTNAKPGDTITFTVTMGPVEALGTLQMVMDIPAGLTYVAKSGTTINKAELGFDDIAFTDESLMINGVRSEYEEGGKITGGYVSTTDTTIGSYQVTVDENAAAGDYTVGLTNLEFYDCYDWEEATSMYNVIPAVVTIGASEDATQPATEAVTEAVTEAATEAVTEAATEAVTEAATEAQTEAATEPVHVHDIVFVPEVPATTTADGMAAHYECTDPGCAGKYFADATGSAEVSLEDLIIPKIVPTEPVTEAATEAVTEAATEAATEAVTEAATEAVTEAATEAATEAVTPTEDATQAAEDPTEVVTPTEGATEASTEAATQAATTPASKDQSTKDSSNKTTTSPKTGDSTNMYLWMLIMLASMVGAGAVLYTAKRKGIFTK